MLLRETSKGLLERFCRASSTGRIRLAGCASRCSRENKAPETHRGSKARPDDGATENRADPEQATQSQLQSHRTLGRSVSRIGAATISDESFYVTARADVWWF